MTYTKQIAKHLREVHFGGNWTWVNLQDTLKDISWQHATTKVQSFNTIAALVYHINYFVCAVLQVLRKEPFTAKDMYSFDLPPINSEKDWKQLTQASWTDAEALALLIEQLPDDILNEDFYENKYGNYYRNLHGVIEHSHYHLGQIVIIKKLLQAQG